MRKRQTVYDNKNRVKSKQDVTFLLIFLMRIIIPCQVYCYHHHDSSVVSSEGLFIKKIPFLEKLIKQLKTLSMKMKFIK